MKCGKTGEGEKEVAVERVEKGRQNSEAMISIDMPAGPSEVLVIADKYASPVHIAADMLSQLSKRKSESSVKTFQEESLLQKLLATVTQCLLVDVFFKYMYSPEHLIVNVKDTEQWECFIENAGPWTPESVGDYASGTNHVFPTYGYARMYGGVSLDSFLKYMTVQSLTEEGLKKLGPYVATMAEVEGLEAHKRAVTLRLQDIEARSNQFGLKVLVRFNCYVNPINGAKMKVLELGDKAKYR
ncbi:histidinol dehydrogenase, chloroplastic-like [Mangifera indica]|uniref:histidinol dehydrogenase, chloroplastic-like n=1 Tax=Mangifera indica TaxID=29780 RepID=UPI001CF96B27|nr:histidinol dehydrogenase, chloroplastic-like [Mangifera indica]